MELKIGLKYSLIFFLLTTFLFCLYNVIFNIQDIGQFGLYHQIFDTYFTNLVYIIILVFAYKEVIKKSGKGFYKILIISFLIIVFSYVFKYISDWLFHYLNQAINKPEKTREYRGGILALLNEFEGFFHKPRFSFSDFLYNTFILPFQLLVYFLYSRQLAQFLYTLFTSKLLLTTFVIYFFNLFHLFKKYNRSGLHAVFPIKNNLVLLNITHKPTWWILPLYIPLLRFIPKYFINKEIAKTFHYSNAFAFGMTFLPWFFYGKLVFDKAKTDELVMR